MSDDFDEEEYDGDEYERWEGLKEDPLPSGSHKVMGDPLTAKLTEELMEDMYKGMLDGDTTIAPFDSWLPKPTKKKCECGAMATGSSLHSGWCPLNEG